MRILVLPKEFPSEHSPQAGIFILRRVQALRELGHDIEVLRVVPHAPPFGKKWQSYRAIPHREEVDGIPVRTIRAFMPPHMIGMEYLPLQVHHSIAREIERFKPDIVHASFLIPCGQIAVRHGVPSVVTSHGVDAYGWPNRRPGLHRAAHEALSRATRITAVSGFIARCLDSIVSRPVDVIWNGGDERFFFPRERTEARRALALDPERPLIAYAGNLLRAKGLYELLEAADALREQRPIIAVAGAGPEAEELQRRANARRLDLRLFGRLDAAQVGELFGAADVVTLPSYSEGLPNVVCEAMLASRAVVASTAGGIPEIVADEKTGILIPPRNARALAEALGRVISDPALRDRLAGAARAFAQQHLTWRISARGYDRVFHEIVNA